MQQNDPNKLIQQGLIALQNNQPSDAKKVFEGLINKGVVNASIWLAMAYACRDLDDQEGLLDAVDKSLDLEGQNPRAYILKGDYFDKKNELRAASTFYLKGLEVAPPIDQTPSDLKPELERAQARYQALINTFEKHFYNEICQSLDLEKPEARRVKSSIDFFTGKKTPYLQQPKKFYFPELANIEFADPKGFDWVEKIEAIKEDILEELLNVIKVNKGFNPYLQGSDNKPESDGGGLRDNDEWSAYFLWESGEKIEENAARCPKTVEFFENHYDMPKAKGRWPNVLFSKLCANTKIPPHNGLYNMRFICHLPLIIPDKCGFRVGNDVREWEEGKVWIFDDSIEHEAWNDSDEDRYILLFEVWRPELTQLERSMVSKILAGVNNF